MAQDLKENTTLTVRHFSFRKDIRAIMTIEKSVFGRDAFPMLEFLYLQQIGKDLVLVAILDDNIVGYISAYTQDNKGYIASIAVLTLKSILRWHHRSNSLIYA